MSLKSLSDRELLAKMLPDSDTEVNEAELAWLEFIDRFERLIFNSITAILQRKLRVQEFHKEDIVDLMQQVFFNLSKDDYAGLRKFKFNSDFSLKAYLKAVAVNATIDHIRAVESSKRIQATISINGLVERQDSLDFEENGCELIDNRTRNPEELLLEKEFVEKLYRIVDKISGKHHRERNRRIFDLIYWHGYSVEEVIVKEQIDIAPMGIYAILHRIKKGIAAKLSYA